MKPTDRKQKAREYYLKHKEEILKHNKEVYQKKKNGEPIEKRKKGRKKLTEEERKERKRLRNQKLYEKRKAAGLQSMYYKPVPKKTLKEGDFIKIKELIKEIMESDEEILKIKNTLTDIDEKLKNDLKN